MSRENFITPLKLENGKNTGARKKEILTPVDKCLFLDLDMTLINCAYQITEPRIFKTIARLQNAGWEIGLNSNTPLDPLLVWMRYFGMKGPLIAEKGTVVYDNGKITFNQELARLIQVSRKAIKRHLKAASIQWLSGNPVDVIRDGKFGKPQPGPLVLLNTKRKCSLNFYVREVTSRGQIIINSELTTSMVEQLRKYYLGINDLEENVDLKNGILLVMPTGQAKRNGTRTFMENRKLIQIGIIGDSMNDFLGEDIAVHYAVSNAKDDYKSKAVFVSKFSMTKGCIDILERLAK